MPSPTLFNEVSFLNALNPDNSLVTSASSSYWTYSGDTARKWGSSTAGTSGNSVSYYFAPSSNFTTQEKTTIQECFALWSAVANISFVLASGANAASSANVLLQRGATGSGEYFSDEGHVTPGSGSTLGSYNGQTLINFDSTTPGFELTGSFSTYGGYGLQSIVHEMGHLIGLGHGGAYNGNVTSSTQQYSAYDSRQWSIMSYIAPYDTSAKYYASYPVSGTNWGNATDGSGAVENSTTMMPLDILAAQQLYGAPVSTPLSGNNIFGFNCNISGLVESFYDFTKNTHPVVTLYDTGTNNSLDLSGFSQAATINLTAGSFSSCDGMTNNLGIAFNTHIDTVICGGSGNRLTGNGDGDTYEDTLAHFNSDTITNFTFGDKLYITDASTTNLTFNYASGVLTLGNGSTTASLSFSTLPSTTFVEQADSSGTGVDLSLSGTASISGTRAGQTTSAEAAVRPFSSVTISDSNVSALDSLTISLTGSGGSLAGSGLSGGTNGVYTLGAGSAAGVTALLDALVFTPSAAVPSAVSTTTFTIRDSSSAGTISTDSTTTVIDTAAAAVPSITGTAAGQTTTSEAFVRPFAGATITDTNLSARDTLTITVSGGGGTLSGAGLTGGANGIYTIRSNTPATVTARLDALVFTPAIAGAGLSATTSFTLNLASSAGTSATDSTTTVIDSDPAPVVLPSGDGSSGGGSSGGGTDGGGTPVTGTTGGGTSGDGSSGGDTSGDGGGSAGGGTAGGGTTVTSTPGVAFTQGIVFTNAHSATLTGTVSDPSGTVASVEIFDGGTSLGLAALNGDGTWTLANATLGAGDHSLTAIATDASGAASAATPASFSLTTGITGAPYSADEEDFDGSGNLTGEIFTKANGSVYLADAITTLATGEHEVDDYTGSYFNKQAFSYRTDLYSADYSTLETETLYNNNGTHKITGYDDDQTLKALGSDTMTGGGSGETFLFKPHFGSDKITDFHAQGSGHDIISLSSSEFSSIAEILQNTQMQGHNAVIHVSSHDTIVLQNVSKTVLLAHKNDFVLHA